jgi:MoxR-like ATPase
MTDQSSDASHHNGAPGQHDAEQTLTHVRETYGALRTEIAKVIVGQDEVVEQILTCIFCKGHALVVGVPGLAKTLLISTIARTMSLDFSRIQFTPDLMPSDITGTEVIEEDRTTGHRALRFVHGPVFANVILADEINRTPPKTQAALLESMQERQVTVGGVRHELPTPFFVLATQNPLEQEGTYPLPEAQLDRFMFQILIRYPSEAEELEVMRRSAHKAEVTIERVVSPEDIARVTDAIRKVPISDEVMRYALRLVRTTRVAEMTAEHDPASVPRVVRDYVSWGAGPRASEYLILGAKARALFAGATHATHDHVREVAVPVLRHRVLLNFNAEADQVTGRGRDPRADRGRADRGIARAGAGADGRCLSVIWQCTGNERAAVGHSSVTRGAAGTPRLGVDHPARGRDVHEQNHRFWPRIAASGLTGRPVHQLFPESFIFRTTASTMRLARNLTVRRVVCPPACRCLVAAVCDAADSR